MEGFVGNFKSTVSSNGNENALEHGIAIIATGANEFKPSEYSYGEDPRVLTQLELDKNSLKRIPPLKITTAVFIQCVGSREPDRPYCSRVCCTHAIDNAIDLKE